MKENKTYNPAKDEGNAHSFQEPAVAYAATAGTGAVAGSTSIEYNGFITDDLDEFERYKSELIAEAMDDAPGLSWDEVRQQIKDRHTWLR